MYIELFNSLIKKAENNNLSLTYYQNLKNVIDNITPNESIYLTQDSIDIINNSLNVKIKEFCLNNSLGIPNEIYLECELLYDSMIEEEPFPLELNNNKLDLRNQKYEQDILYNKPRMKFIKDNLNYIDMYFNSRGTNFLMLSLKTRNKIYIRYIFEEFSSVFFGDKYNNLYKNMLSFSNMNGDNFFMMLLKESCVHNWQQMNDIYNQIFNKYFSLIDFTHRNNDGDNFLTIYMKNQYEANNDLIKSFLLGVNGSNILSKINKDYGFENVNNEGNNILYYLYTKQDYYFNINFKKVLENHKLIKKHIKSDMINNLNLKNESFLMHIVKYQVKNFTRFVKNNRILPELINIINKYGTYLNVCQKDIDGKNLLYYCVKNDIDLFENIMTLMKKEMIKNDIKSTNYTKLILEDLINQDKNIFKDYFKNKNDNKSKKNDTLLMSLIKNRVIDNEEDYIELIKHIDVDYINKYNKHGDNFLIYASKKRMYSLVKELFKIKGIDLIQRNKQNYSIFTFVLNEILFDEISGKELFELFLMNYSHSNKYNIDMDIESLNSTFINELKDGNNKNNLTINKVTDLSQIFVMNSKELTTQLFNKIDLRYKREELIFLKIKYYSINRDLYNHLYNIYRFESIEKLNNNINKNLNMPKEIMDTVFDSIYSI